jgi:hypothetical protein
VLEAVPGVVVEAVRGVDAFRDPGAGVALAATLTGGVSPAVSLRALLDGLPSALWATWAAAVRADRGATVIEAGAGGVPDLSGTPASWAPLRAARSLVLADWAETAEWGAARRAGMEVAAAPAGAGGADGDRAVLVGRVGGPAFRPAELRVLADLVRIAVGGPRHPAGDLPAAVPGATAPAGPAATAGRS